MPETSALNLPESPIALLGTITLLLAFLVAAYSAAAGIIGNLKERRRLVSSSVYSLYGFLGLMMLASALLIYAFVSHDYSIKYVYRYSDTSMPIYYKITAYWGGLDGSLMFWVSVLAAFSAIAVRANAHRHRDMIGYVVAVIMLVQLFFLALLVYNKNPFATFLTEPPPDGRGLNPLLQNYWMVIHPPSLYIGYVAATIPFAFGIAALASGRLDDRWMASVRSWTLICWFFLSFGLILGGRWAYEELGWGGYWAWDPVENAGLLPWFTMTAFLHSVIIQEQRGMMKTWNMVLVVVTFFLTIFGTFMTRSGVVQSVHAFGEDNALALLFILFMVAVLIVSFGLLVYRLPRLRSSATFESYLSREYAFLLNNWILLGCALFVLFATMFPTLSEALNGQRITVGPPFFNRIMIPLGLILLFLAGAAPLLAYRRTTRDRLWNQFAMPVGVMAVVIAGLAIFVPRTLVMTQIIVKTTWLKAPVSLICFGLVAFTLACVAQEFWRGTRVRMKQTDGDVSTSLIGLVLTKRRKYGGYIIHAAIAVMFFGFAGKAYEDMSDFTVEAGDTFSDRGYTFYFHDLYVSDDDHKRAVTARVALYQGDVEVGGEVKFGTEDVEGIGGEFLSTLYPARWQYKKSDEQPTTEVDMVNYLEEDVYIILTGYNEESHTANFRVYINPLVNWVWLGFFLLIVGTIICLVPASWVETVKAPRTTRRGKVTEVTLILLALGGITAGGVRVASAQAPVEHEKSAHVTGGGVAQLYQPDDPSFLEHFQPQAIERVKKARPGLDPKSPEFAAAVAAELEPVQKLAHRLYSDLVCLCGCNRRTLRGCDCGNAANERKIALGLMTTYDLFDPAQRDRAYDEIVEAFVQRHGDELVLAEPRQKGLKPANKVIQWLPYIILVGALFFIFLIGRRWVRRGRRKVAESSSEIDEADQDYIDALEDELADID